MKTVLPEMNSRDALNIDRDFDIRFDNDYGYWLAYGLDTGFCYHMGTEDECNNKIEELYDRKVRQYGGE